VETTPAVPTVSQEPPARKPDWRLVTIFYAVCLTVVSLVSLGLYFAGANLSTTGAQLTFQFTIAFLYMPAPLFSALIAERVGKRRPLIRTTFVGFGRKLPRLLLTYAALSTILYLTYLLFAFLFGNVVHVPGVGDLVTSQAGLTENVTTMFADIAKGRGVTPPTAESLTMPPLGLLYAIALVGGLVAGVTINGLFAFGEEYGWRGFLMDELRPLGAMRANLLTGVLWGLFHAPIILMGFNYAPYRFLGIPAMVVLCTPFSFLLWRARQYTDSLLIPAMLHGAFNAYAGFFLLLLVGRNPLVSLPVGLFGAAAIASVAFVFWKWSEGRLAEDHAYAQTEEAPGTVVVAAE
jgi:membrane protease YdiL (CAAX protease family)